MDAVVAAAAAAPRPDLYSPEQGPFATPNPAAPPAAGAVLQSMSEVCPHCLKEVGLLRTCPETGALHPGHAPPRPAHRPSLRRSSQRGTSTLGASDSPRGPGAPERRTSRVALISPVAGDGAADPFDRRGSEMDPAGSFGNFGSRHSSLTGRGSVRRGSLRSRKSLATAAFEQHLRNKREMDEMDVAIARFEEEARGLDDFAARRQSWIDSSGFRLGKFQMDCMQALSAKKAAGKMLAKIRKSRPVAVTVQQPRRRHHLEHRSVLRKGAVGPCFRAAQLFSEQQQAQGAAAAALRRAARSDGGGGGAAERWPSATGAPWAGDEAALALREAAARRGDGSGAQDTEEKRAAALSIQRQQEAARIIQEQAAAEYASGPCSSPRRIRRPRSAGPCRRPAAAARHGGAADDGVLDMERRCMAHTTRGTQPLWALPGDHHDGWGTKVVHRAPAPDSPKRQAWAQAKPQYSGAMFGEVSGRRDADILSAGSSALSPGDAAFKAQGQIAGGVDWRHLLEGDESHRARLNESDDSYRRMLRAYENYQAECQRRLDAILAIPDGHLLGLKKNAGEAQPASTGADHPAVFGAKRVSE